MEKRVDFFDVARGFAMLLVVLSHCVGGGIMGLNKFILCFHMPLFFFISGYFAKTTTKAQLFPYLWHKVKVLFVPQLFLCVLRIIQSVLTCVFSGKGILEVQWLNWDWFLPVLFVCTLIYTVITAFFNNDTILIKCILFIVALIMVYPGQLLNKHEFYYYAILNSRHMAVIPMAFCFYICGSLLKDFINKSLATKELSGLVTVILIALTYIFANMNSMVLMYKNEYGNLPIFIISSIVGISMALRLSKALDTSKFLSFCGKNSVAIYVWNFLIVQIAISISNKIVGVTGLYNLSVGMLAFVIAVPVLIFIVKITNKYTPWLYGRQSYATK